ncbi:hypothetical protein CYQ88_00685 [Hydrogenovibrio sp. SC-1]|uniref:helix-turn-helix domain-containing protein n=1 Tax=Hydrogenovibrio sp. SC-1 TaxID=2065820 RepID=UPI000C7BB00B|nr:helix-turn-helix transcriptional regulator [Hydrogenovibrio sp. SC-1]PLA75517.1 hypothetical protein CYQ88_00685 [Hydrogenovibrio sp. SC-1]
MVNEQTEESRPENTVDATRLANALRKAREAKGWSIDEVAEKLKVGAEHLAYLESDQLDITSLDPFKRGYLRNYAEIVGLDITAYSEIFSDVKATEAPLISVSSEDPSIKPVFSMATLKIITSVVIILLIALLVVINL